MHSKYDSTRLPFVANSQCTQTDLRHSKKGKLLILQVSWPVAAASRPSSYVLKALIMARLGSVRVQLPLGFFTEKALRGAQLPWAASLLTRLSS